MNGLAEQVASMGAVYLVRAGCAGPVKIGWAFDIEARVKTLQTGNREPLNLVAFIAGSRVLEIEMHRLFADRALRGEWFDDRDGEISDVFCGLMTRWKSGEFYQ